MDAVCTHIFQRRDKENWFLLASGLTWDCLERLTSRALEMKQKHCSLLKARLREKDLQLSGLGERNSSNYAKNMLTGPMNPVVGYNHLIGRSRQSTLPSCCCSKER